MQDIRWQQRFSNFRRALTQLEKAVQLFEQRPLSELEMQGLIQGFEYTYELAWNVLKDYLKMQGFQQILGPRDAIMEAFRLGLLANGEAWMMMFRDRNKTSHTYNENTAHQVVEAIVSIYWNLFKDLETVLLAQINPNPPLL
jgi:nucleotidyltransferase substrate binding protein (TIGR01987 family)